MNSLWYNIMTHTKIGHTNIERLYTVSPVVFLAGPSQFLIYYLTIIASLDVSEVHYSNQRVMLI